MFRKKIFAFRLSTSTFIKISGNFIRDSKKNFPSHRSSWPCFNCWIHWDRQLTTCDLCWFTSELVFLLSFLCLSFVRSLHQIIIITHVGLECLFIRSFVRSLARCRKGILHFLTIGFSFHHRCDLFDSSFCSFQGRWRKRNEEKKRSKSKTWQRRTRKKKMKNYYNIEQAVIFLLVFFPRPFLYPFDKYDEKEREKKRRKKNLQLVVRRNVKKKEEEEEKRDQKLFFVITNRNEWRVWQFNWRFFVGCSSWFSLEQILVSICETKMELSSIRLLHVLVNV